MTPCEELGYKVGDVFEVIGGAQFKSGSIVSLTKDDGSDCPAFTLNNGWYYIGLRHVKPYLKTNPNVDLFAIQKCKSEMLSSLDKALRQAGGCPDDIIKESLTLADMVDNLAHNGIRFTYDPKGKGETK